MLSVLLLVANAYWLGHTCAPLILCFTGRDWKQHLKSFLFRSWLLLFFGYAILSHDRYSIAIVAMIAGLVAWQTRSWPLFWAAVIGGTAAAEWSHVISTIDAGRSPGLLSFSRWEVECSLVPALVGGMLGGGVVVITTLLFRRFHGRFETERPEDNPVS